MCQEHISVMTAEVHIFLFTVKAVISAASEAFAVFLNG